MTNPSPICIQRVYGGCPATTGFIQRAAATPAQTGVAGWASELVASTNIGFLALVPRTVLAQLIDRPGVLVLEGAGPFKIAARALPLTLAGGWVAEAAPKPVAEMTIAADDLAPKKLSALICFTEEMLERSVLAVEAVVKNALEHDLGAILNTTLAGTAAASSTTPPGLFAGASTPTASTATPGEDALHEDAGALIAAISGDNPDASPTFIAPPAQAARLRIAGFDAIASGFMAAGTVGVVDTSAFAAILEAPAFRDFPQRRLAYEHDAAGDRPAWLAEYGRSSDAEPVPD